MAIIKCKMCGGDLKITGRMTVAECEYCGTKQTVPTFKDEGLQGLFNRANTLRLKCEFDRSESLYEKIIQNDPTQAEAYWGLILCKYGIEYVEDPATFKRIPTCHRASYDSIIADEDYKLALKYADTVQKSVYEEQANEIDRIQKEILTLSQKEDPYDVFICYKETDESGKRTQDSVIANEIYYQLVREGFKVFYAAITLENKLGAAYEPCIFAALNSAKVMLAIGTKPEYFNAVWVKNEWSRFLKIIKKDSSKILIPCYRDMDAYELPDEFAHLQAQDMSKIGFINDLLRGIKKVLNKENSTSDDEETYTISRSADIEPLLKRVFMFLEDRDWKSADDYSEKVLDQDPENAEAYLGKFLAELNLSDVDELANINLIKCKSGDVSSISSRVKNLNYKKIVKFGNEELVSKVNGYINSCTTALIKQGDAFKEKGEFEKARTSYLSALESDITSVDAHWCILLAENKCITNEDLFRTMVAKNKNLTSYISDLKTKGYTSDNYTEYENINRRLKDQFQLQYEDAEKQIKETERQIENLDLILDELNSKLKNDIEKHQFELSGIKRKKMAEIEKINELYKQLSQKKKSCLEKKDNPFAFLSFGGKKKLDNEIENIHKQMQECMTNQLNIKREIKKMNNESGKTLQKEEDDIKDKIEQTRQSLEANQLKKTKLIKQSQEYLLLSE